MERAPVQRVPAPGEPATRALPGVAVSSVTIPVPPTLPQVDSEDVPDYYTIIKNPMDLSTMREKLYDGEYTWCVVVGQRARVSSDHAWLRLQQLTQTHVLPPQR